MAAARNVRGEKLFEINMDNLLVGREKDRQNNTTN